MRSDELIDEIAVGSMQLDSIETALFGKLNTVFEIFFGCFDVIEGHLFGNRVFQAVMFERLISILNI